MTRGQQKIQSQQRNAKKQADLKKGTDQRKTAEVSLVYQCIVCKARMGDTKTYRQHFDNKHPKIEVPEEIKDVTYTE